MAVGSLFELPRMRSVDEALSFRVVEGKTLRSRLWDREDGIDWLEYRIDQASDVVTLRSFAESRCEGLCIEGFNDVAEIVVNFKDGDELKLLVNKPGMKDLMACVPLVPSPGLHPAKSMRGVTVEEAHKEKKDDYFTLLSQLAGLAFLVVGIIVFWSGFLDLVEMAKQEVEARIFGRDEPDIVTLGAIFWLLLKSGMAGMIASCVVSVVGRFIYFQRFTRAD